MHMHICMFIYIYIYLFIYLFQPELCFLTDIDECLDGSLNRCDQICINTMASFICGCNTGFQLNDDLMTCSGMWNDLFKYVKYMHAYISQCLQLDITHLYSSVFLWNNFQRKMNKTCISSLIQLVLVNLFESLVFFLADTLMSVTLLTVHHYYRLF